MKKRSSGVLLHISSLPGPYGIGDFGKEAMKFIDFLSEMGCRYWQVLPFSLTDGFNSPYASPSAFAGNYHYIDLEQLAEQGLITKEELLSQRREDPYTADFDFVRGHRMNTLYKAYLRADETLRKRVRDFIEENRDWFPDYALFILLKEAQGGLPWNQWAEPYKFREPAALAEARMRYSDTIFFLGFCQYLFFSQWKRVLDYAAKRDVRMMGDMPIYVGVDSADVWSNRALFDVDSEGRANHVAGVPPDYFSADGQKWGQALYRWDVMKKDGYHWWMKRLEKNFERYHVLRIDHFRAFASYWQVDAEAETARDGVWMEGPGYGFFEVLFKTFPQARIVAEDLGMIDDGVRRLLEQTRLPGMRVMQFGFLDFSDNLHLPHNYPKDSFAYTGTHDNNTMLGWLWEAGPRERAWALDYCNAPAEGWEQGGKEGKAVPAILRTLWQSPAGTVIVPVQDLLSYGGDTRMNRPGVPTGNWQFRVTWDQLHEVNCRYIKELNETYKR